MDPDALIYKKEVSSFYVRGSAGEFELLAYHYPVLCLIQEDSDLVIDWSEFLTAKKGIVKFFKNECTAIVELSEDFSGYFPSLV